MLGPGPARRLLAPVLAAVAAALLAAGPAAAQQRPRFDVRVLAHIPDPGFAAASMVGPDGNIYAGSFENPAGDSVPSRVWAFSPTDGHIVHTYVIQGQDLSKAHGVQTAILDSAGRIVLLDQSPPRALLLDPATGSQTVYATFHDVPTCAAAGRTTDCSQTLTDNAPEPDFAAWGPDGSLYVTDYQQSLIWRVPPGGGAAQVWFTDPRIDGGMFGPAGIVLEPDHHTLMFDGATNGAEAGLNPSTGSLWTLSINPDGSPGTLQRLWESGPREAPDGFAVAQSGDVYVALVGPAADQLVELSPTGSELARFPSSELANQAMPVPFDEPASATFDGDRLIVTNLSYFAGNRTHQVLFDVFAGEPGRPIYVPAAAAQVSNPVGSVVRLRLTVRPRRVVAGRRTRLRFTLLGSGRGVAGATIRLAGRRARTGPAGTATLTVRLRRAGRYRAVATSGTGSASATVTATAPPRHRRAAARFTG